MNLPLPIGEIAFNSGSEQPLTTLTELYQQPNKVPGVSQVTPPSVMAELMTLMLSW